MIDNYIFFLLCCHLLHTHTGNLKKIPELLLSLHLHLHHCFFCSFYILHCFLQLGEQINDALLTHQNCATENRRDGEGSHKSNTENY